MNQGPIFIGGLDRCGKTMLRAFLVSHPHISIPAIGSNMWTYFYGQYGNLRHLQNFERCLAAMLRYRHVQILQPDADRIRREFWQGEPTYARLFALFQAHHAEAEGKPRWGDQSGLIERYARLIFAAYPSTKIIHMIRDPRDRYAESLTLWQHGKGRVGAATARWLHSVRLARRNQTLDPDRYKVVYYERLVSEPERTLRDVCAFLGEDYVPAMLAMEGARGYREKLGGGSSDQTSPSPVSTEYIGRFRQIVPKREVAFMQAYAGRDMVANGYRLEPLDFSSGDRLAYYCVDWPANLARMAAWLLTETIQQNFPRVWGRRYNLGESQLRRDEPLPSSGRSLSSDRLST